MKNIRCELKVLSDGRSVLRVGSAACGGHPPNTHPQPMVFLSACLFFAAVRRRGGVGASFANGKRRWTGARNAHGRGMLGVPLSWASCASIVA